MTKMRARFAPMLSAIDMLDGGAVFDDNSTRHAKQGRKFMAEEQEGSSGDDVARALSVVADTAGDIVMGIPAPIRNNVFKALSQLCTAVVEYPVALIENAI